MTKTTYFFTSNNCISRKGYTGPKGPNVVTDPDLSEVEGVKRHYWKLVNGKVLPMNALERAARDEHIAKHGADNATAPQKIRHPMIAAAPLVLKPLLYTALGALLAHLLGV